MADLAYQRLRWHCRRGMLELDLVLQGFLDRRYVGLKAEEVEAFTALLEYPDQTLLAWLNGMQVVTDDKLRHIVTTIRQHADNKS